MRYYHGCRHLVTVCQGRVWEPLGLSDWGAFVENTFDVEQLNIERRPTSNSGKCEFLLHGTGLNRL